MVSDWLHYFSLFFHSIGDLTHIIIFTLVQLKIPQLGFIETFRWCFIELSTHVKGRCSKISEPQC
ncbi:hypothetical protein VAEU17_4400371 [Vibrio aestuarianus]|nr:hypothetical protein VAEU17_4400371 [Vibrio aestuarianus]